MAVLARLLLALVVVFATYNPEGVSYLHWLQQGGGPLPLKVLAGVVLLIAWLFLLRTAASALGALGLVLAGAFFAALIWVVMSLAHLEAHSLRAVTYLVGLALAGVLSVGLGWSKVRQKLTGQVDTE